MSSTQARVLSVFSHSYMSHGRSSCVTRPGKTKCHTHTHTEQYMQTHTHTDVVLSSAEMIIWLYLTEILWKFFMINESFKSFVKQKCQNFAGCQILKCFLSLFYIAQHLISVDFGLVARQNNNLKTCDGHFLLFCDTLKTTLLLNNQKIIINIWNNENNLEL